MIQFKNVALNLGNKQLLKQFNYTITQGAKIILSAPSGSGKTSILKLILGFINANEGTIRVNQDEAKPDKLHLIRNQIGYLSQDVDFPNGRVDEVFQEIFNYSANRSIPYSEEKLIEKLADVNLSADFIHKNTDDISGGERQRLGWVLLMLLDRPILLLDEPTTAMDEKQKQFFIDYVANSPKTVLCISHDPNWQFIGTKVISTILT